jgi:NadR type nicotinamide-nucleotide adenylyltransferase
VRYRHGLVVGKFSPLHRGHEWLIGNALDQCETVTVLSYSKPEFAGCERTRREAWLTRRFPMARLLVLDDAVLRDLCAARGVATPRLVPSNDATDDEQRLFVAWVCDRLLETAVDAVFTSEAYGEGFAAALDEYFRLSGSSIGTVKHICVDPARERYPVSGTQVRADPLAYRDLLSPPVYASFVKRVCVLGGESSGKSTLALALAERLRTTYVPEYGRELWETKGGRLDFGELVSIARVQIERESLLAEQARRWLVCDTSPLTTLFYSQELFGSADPELVALAERHYDRVLLCKPDFEFVQDGTRRDTAFREHGHRWYQAELAKRGVPFIQVGGSVQARVEAAVAALGGGPIDDADS